MDEEYLSKIKIKIEEKENKKMKYSRKSTMNPNNKLNVTQQKDVILSKKNKDSYVVTLKQVVWKELVLINILKGKILWFKLAHHQF